jgi:hypothetical protein
MSMRMLLPLIGLLIAAGPAAPVISYEPKVNFGHYRSYSWVFNHTPSGMNPNLYRQLRVAIDHSLEAHGFVKSQPGDFAVAFTVGPRAYTHSGDYGHYAPYYRGNNAAEHASWVNNELAQRSTHDNTLAIDIYDRETKRAIWHGLAPDPVKPGMRQAALEHEVNAVLSLFPAKG